MSKAVRTALSLGLSLVLLSALTMAQAGGNNAGKDKSKQHHSRLAKVAFWHHHKDADQNANPAKQAAGQQHQNQGQHASNVSKPSKKAPAANNTEPRQ
jgi:hypothetical protein